MRRFLIRLALGVVLLAVRPVPTPTLSADGCEPIPPWRTVLDVQLTNVSDSAPGCIVTWNHTYSCLVKDYPGVPCVGTPSHRLRPIPTEEPTAVNVVKQVSGAAGGSGCDPAYPIYPPPAWPPPDSICCQGFDGVCSPFSPPPPPPDDGGGPFDRLPD